MPALEIGEIAEDAASNQPFAEQVRSTQVLGDTLAVQACLMLVGCRFYFLLGL